MNIGVSSPRVLIRKSLCALLSQTQGFQVVLDLNTPSDDLELIRKSHLDVLLIDAVDTVSCSKCLSQLRTLVPEIKIVLLSDGGDEEYQLQAIRQGARGFVWKTCEPATLEKALKLVAKGEIWASHQVLSRLIGKFMRWQDPEHDNLVKLTRREREILTLLAQGCRNKEIAGILAVSENTIRAHLVKLYRKIRVTDRLTAALYYFERAKQKGQRSSVESGGLASAPTFGDAETHLQVPDRTTHLSPH